MYKNILLRSNKNLTLTHYFLLKINSKFKGLKKHTGELPPQGWQQEFTGFEFLVQAHLDLGGSGGHASPRNLGCVGTGTFTNTKRDCSIRIVDSFIRVFLSEPLIPLCKSMENQF